MKLLKSATVHRIQGKLEHSARPYPSQKDISPHVRQ